MFSVQLPPGWFVAVRENPSGKAAVAPNGRMFHCARSRAEAVRVLGTTMGALDRSDPGAPLRLATAYPDLVEAMTLVFHGITAGRVGDFDATGCALSQLIDAANYEVTWADLGIAVACG